MLLLALDTATSAVTVALHDGERTLAESTALDARRHAELLAPAITEVLRGSGRAAGDVTAVVAGTGPGPFTGLRVGLVTARTFAFAAGIPVHGVCSLDALAHGAWLRAPEGLGGRFLVATDARRKEVYWAAFDVTEDGVLRDGPPRVDKPAEVPEEVRALPTVGRGPVLYPEAFPRALEPLDVSAAVLADLAVRALRDPGRAARVLTAADPLYLRRPDAQPHPARKPVLS